MGKIIALDAFREQGIVRKGFKRWRRRFDQTFDAQTGLADLTPYTLYQLSLPGGEALTYLYDMIIGFMGYGQEVGFDDLDSVTQIGVLDIHLFISDQIRFEMMYRLGWLDRYTGNRFTLLQFVREHEQVKKSCKDDPPVLAQNHTDFDAYCPLFELDRQIFLRRLFPAVSIAFKEAHDL